MGVANIQLHKITGVKVNKANRYELIVRLASDNSMVSPTLLSIAGEGFRGYLTSDNVWMIPIEQSQLAQDCNIEFLLVKSKKKSKNLGKMSLPIKWFPYDFCVHQRFPMHNLREKETKYRPIFIDMSVHISTNGAEPFHAPPGNLLVKPLWNDPSPIKPVNTPNSPPHSSPKVYPGNYNTAPRNNPPPQCEQVDIIVAEVRYNQPVGQSVAHHVDYPVVPRVQYVAQHQHHNHIPHIEPPKGIPPISAGPTPQIFTHPLD